MSGLGPPILKSSIRSWNCPWISPQTVTGHFWQGSVSKDAPLRRGERLHILLAEHWILLVKLPVPTSSCQSCFSTWSREEGGAACGRASSGGKQQRQYVSVSCPKPHHNVPKKHHHSRLTFSQSLWTSTSASCLHFIKLSIQPSSVGIDAGSVCTGDTSAGARPTSSMLVSMSLLLLLSSIEAAIRKV